MFKDTHFLTTPALLPVAVSGWSDPSFQSTAVAAGSRAHPAAERTSGRW